MRERRGARPVRVAAPPRANGDISNAVAVVGYLGGCVLVGDELILLLVDMLTRLDGG